MSDPEESLANAKPGTRSAGPTPSSGKEVVLGTLVDVDADGIAWVDYPGNPDEAPLRALSTTPVGGESIGRQAALLFVEGDPRRPVLMGLVRTILDRRDSVAMGDADASNKAQSARAEESIEIGTDRVEDLFIDGRRVQIEADHEIVLKCGKSSITLTRSGKILIRGSYLLSRSSGVNRIKGGSVQIN